MQCSICLEDNPDYTLSMCGHKFHRECIEEWLSIKPECPLCRRSCITRFSYYYIYKIFKKGEITISNHSILLKQNKFFRGRCRLAYKNIRFTDIKKLEYNPYYFSVFYIKNNRIKFKKIYTRRPDIIFNICKYHVFNN